MKKVNLTKPQLEIIKKILSKCPNTVIYGSRTKDSSKNFSDLDVCLKDAVSAYEYELIAEAFENSDLPFKVDLSEYQKLPAAFKKIIDEQGILLAKF